MKYENIEMNIEELLELKENDIDEYVKIVENREFDEYGLRDELESKYDMDVCELQLVIDVFRMKYINNFYKDKN